MQAARRLSTRNLRGVTLYSPGELIVSARAGTTVAELGLTLKEKGQHLLAEPPDLSALLGAGESTLGGVVAANLSGEPAPRPAGLGEMLLSSAPAAAAPPAQDRLGAWEAIVARPDA